MDYEGYNVSHLSKICKIDGKRYKVLETLDSDFAKMLTANIGLTLSTPEL